MDCSIFIDESGGQKGHSKYYGVTLVFHEQTHDITYAIRRYQQALAERGLPDIPMHAGPLLNGHNDYAGMSISERKSLLMTFFTMLQHLPITYATFMYRRANFDSQQAIAARLKWDVINLLFNKLQWLQSFAKIKVYYDDGQEILAHALHDAVEYAISREAIIYREASPTNYRLSQVADMLCTLELTAIKYRLGDQTATDEKFFGSNTMFRRNFLKSMKRKRL